MNSRHKILILSLLIPITLILNLTVSDFQPIPIHPRNVSDQILLVTLSDADIEALGGWPISRDYFGYMIHALSQRGAKTIGLDFLFDQTDSLFQGYDTALAGFIRSSGDVVLPAIIQSNGRALLPARSFREHATIGFSNLGEQSIVQHVPLTISIGDHQMYSFGLQLACHYLGLTENPVIKHNQMILKKRDGKNLDVPIDKNGNFIPDYFGGLDRIRRIGFVELLKTFQDYPDSLDLKGKLVLVAPIAQTLPIIKTIPKYGAVPGSLIHLTVAENFITGNILHPLPNAIKWIISVLITALMIILFYLNRFRLGLILFGALTITLGIVAFVLPVLLHWIIPAQPLLISGLGLLLFAGIEIGLRVHRMKTTNRLLEEEIRGTRDELEAVQSGLMETQSEKDAAVQRLEKHLRDLEAIRLPDISKQMEFHAIIHTPGGKLAKILADIPHIAETDIPILIQGETGTGKELVARAIHQASGRKAKPFTAVNCGALSENLLESELFGHEKGSFTGAVSRRIGRFERADGGTLFLDEIAETSPAFQTRLLRVLQEGSFERVGGDNTLHVNVRIIAATNQNLQEMANTGSFRSDLFYRLNGFSIFLPPLRERTEDIPLLIRHFLARHGYSEIKSVSDQAMEIIRNYACPGNVRELENTIRRAAILAQKRKSTVIQEGDLPENLRGNRTDSTSTPGFVPFDKQVLGALRTFQFSRSAISSAAKALGNKDRGTITEYFRGICFQTLVEQNFDTEKAARLIAGSDDTVLIERVHSKIKEYLKHISKPSVTDADNILSPAFKGLPKQYHLFLTQIIKKFHQ